MIKQKLLQTYNLPHFTAFPFGKMDVQVIVVFFKYDVPHLNYSLLLGPIFFKFFIKYLTFTRTSRDIIFCLFLMRICKQILSCFAVLNQVTNLRKKPFYLEDTWKRFAHIMSLQLYSNSLFSTPTTSVQFYH